MLDSNVKELEDTFANRTRLLQCHKVRIEIIDEFIQNNPNASDLTELCSKRFVSSSFVESRTPTNEYKFVDHETPSHGEHPTVDLGYFTPWS